MGDQVTIIGSKSSIFSARVEWALKLKGVEYEYLHEDVRNKSETLLKYNPIHKKIPVLLHNGKPIAESLVILEYIDETWKKNPLLPIDPHERAMARFWAKFTDEKVVFGVYEACKAQGEEKEKAIENAKELLSLLEKEIATNMFFGGESIGYLDLVIGWVPLWLGVMEQIGEMKLIEPHTFPFLCEWSKKFMDFSPLIEECLPNREFLVEYFTGGINYVRSLEANKSK